jgi:probable rRNA maturation factor
MSGAEIEVLAEVPITSDLIDRLYQTVKATLSHQRVEAPAGVTLLLTDDSTIRKLNQSFLDRAQPTDVLSFPAGEPMPGMDSYLGDVVISVAAAQRQASAGGHSLAAELQLLSVHGLLHLCGHDHAEPAEKSVMWAAQSEILRGLGAEITAPAESQDNS